MYVDAAGGDEESAAAAAPVKAVAALPATVTQSFLICDDGRRRESLRAFLESLPRGRNPARVMVFVNQIKTIKALATSLRKFGLACAALHGDLAQWEREESLQRFRAGAAPVLVTTDVGARGLDIRQLPAVVSFYVGMAEAENQLEGGKTAIGGRTKPCGSLRGLRFDPVKRGTRAAHPTD